jgi:hypothetical protein
MNYAVADGHPSIAQLKEMAESVAEQELPRSLSTVDEVADTILRSIPGAPDASDFDVLALDSEDQDVHLLLRRRSDGLLARASYIEGEDLSDDIDVFEFVSEENRQQIVARFDRWCGYHLEAEDEAAYRALIADMVPVEWSPQRQLEEDLLVIAPTLHTLEGLVGMVGTESLRDTISQALVSMKAAARAA